MFSYKKKLSQVLNHHITKFKIVLFIEKHFKQFIIIFLVHVQKCFLLNNFMRDCIVSLYLDNPIFMHPAYFNFLTFNRDIIRNIVLFSLSSKWHTIIPGLVLLAGPGLKVGLASFLAPNLAPKKCLAWH